MGRGRRIQIVGTNTKFFSGDVAKIGLIPFF
jgi:hypothetical protein